MKIDVNSTEIVKIGLKVYENFVEMQTKPYDFSNSKILSVRLITQINKKKIPSKAQIPIRTKRKNSPITFSFTCHLQNTINHDTLHS